METMNWFAKLKIPKALVAINMLEKTFMREKNRARFWKVSPGPLFVLRRLWTYTSIKAVIDISRLANLNQNWFSSFSGGYDSDNIKLVAGERDFRYDSGNEQRRNLDYFIIHPGSESEKKLLFLILFWILFWKSESYLVEAYFEC